MCKTLFSMVVVLAVAGMASAFTMGGQNYDMNAMLMGMNATSGGPMTGSQVVQGGGAVQVIDGWSQAAANEALLGMQAIQIQGPGAATTVADVSASQLIGAGFNTGAASQDSSLNLGTMLCKESGLGGLSASNSAIVNQGETVVTPTGAVSNSNTSAASVVAGAGPCSTGPVTSCVSIDYCGGASYVAPCWQIPVCPPVVPPCPSPCN